MDTQFNNKEDKEKDKDLVEALFKPDIYKFNNNKVNQEDVKDYNIYYII